MLIMTTSAQKMMDELNDPETAFAFFNAVTRQHAGLSSGVYMVRNSFFPHSRDFVLFQKFDVRRDYC